MTEGLPILEARERPGDHTRRRLFETAVAEFRRVGVARASIGRIAETAGVSRPAFYFHFPTKDHVLLELQWSFEKPIAAQLSAARTLDDALVALVDGLVDAISRVGDGEVFAEMVRIHTRHAASKALVDQPHYLMRAVAARFVEAHAAGRLRGGLNAACATHLFLAGVFGYLSMPVDPEEARRDLRALTSLYFSESGAEPQS